MRWIFGSFLVLSLIASIHAINAENVAYPLPYTADGQAAEAGVFRRSAPPLIRRPLFPGRQAPPVAPQTPPNGEIPRTQPYDPQTAPQFEAPSEDQGVVTPTALSPEAKTAILNAIIAIIGALLGSFAGSGGLSPGISSILEKILGALKPKPAPAPVPAPEVTPTKV